MEDNREGWEVVGHGGAQEGIRHDGVCRNTGRKDKTWWPTEKKDGTWWVMEEDGREEWDTVGDRSTGRRDGMGGQQRSSRRRGGT